MDSPEHSGNYVKQDIEENLDVKRVRAGDGEGWEGSDKRKHRSSKSRKHNRGEDVEVEYGSSRRKTSGDRNERRKSVGGKGESEDDNDYATRKESHYKELKKKQEESSLEKLSNWYQDGELENRQDGADKSSSRGHGQADKNERRKIPLKLPEHEGMKSTTKNREERSCDEDLERKMDRDSRYSERWESSREKSHGDQGRNSKRRWDEQDAIRKVEESHCEKAEMRSGKTSDLKYESSKKRTTSSRTEPNDVKSKSSELNIEKGSKATSREEKRSDAEMSKSKGRSEALEEDMKASPNIGEDRLSREKNEKGRHHRHSSSRDVAETREKSFKADENENSWMRDRSSREVAGHNDRSGTPERSGRRQQETEHSEMEYERSSDLRRKELEKDVYRDDRSKGRDDGWGDRSRDWEGYRESWKRRQPGNNDKGLRDGDNIYDRGRDWEFQRHGRERFESERHHGRSGSRKDGSRGEAVKTSSNFGHVNYDVIEIQTKPIDYVRAESASSFAKRSDLGPQSDMKSLPNDDEWAYAREDRTRGSDASGDDLKERAMDDGVPLRDPSEWRDQKGIMPSRSAGGQNSGGGSQPPYGNQEQGFLVRAPPQVKGSRGGRGGRVRATGRDNQQAGIPLPMMGSPFGPLGMPPPGPMQPLNPTMSPAPGPPISPGVFIPPFSPPVVWPGARGIDMNILGVPPGISPVSSGPSGPRFPANAGSMPNPAMFFNQSGPGRGLPQNTSAPNFNASGSAGRGTPPEKTPGGWAPPRNSGLPGKAPSRGEQNDYSQNFVDTGMRPQNFIRELELTNVEDYPKLRELIQKKDEIVANSASPPMYFKCDLKEFELSPEFFGTKFDVILVDPPWEEYVHRAAGVADHMEYWTFEEILNLKIEAIADTPSFIFLWVGDGVGLEQGRQCLKKWGFRRCEDICWVKTNKTNAAPGLRHDSHTLFQHSKEHCLMGIKGTVRRSTDGHIIHANIDTDVIIAEEPPYGSTRKPEDMYRIIEHFALGRRRLELFGEDHNIRAGWLTVGRGLSSSNFNSEAYIKNFADKEGKVWQGGGGRNPPPEAPHLVLTTPEIEALRPKSPMKNQQQLQHQQSASISLTTANSLNRRAAGNSPQNATGFGLNQEASSSNPPTPAHWGLPMDGFRGREGGSVPPVEKSFEMYGYGGQASIDYMDFDPQRPVNLL